MRVSRAWIVEVDGTLVDNRRIHAESFQSALRETGNDIHHFARSSVPEERLEEVHRRKREIYVAACASGLKTMPGTCGLLEWLLGHGVRLFAASGGTWEETAATLAAARISRWFDHLIDDVADPSEPLPDRLLRTVARVPSPSTGTLLLGSSPRDVAVASRAGIAMLALRCGGHADEELEGATAIYDDPSHLLALLGHRPVDEGIGLRGAGFATLP